MSEEYKALRKLYWESGVWRRYSFEDFVRELFEEIKKIKKSNDRARIQSR